MPPLEVFLGHVEAKFITLRAFCDRCSARIPAKHYHCLQCPNFDLCVDCASKGIYCQNDTHEWIKAEIVNGERFQIGRKLKTNGGKVLQFPSRPYPSAFQSPSNRDTPQSLFANEHRFISSNNPREILIYTDGSCLRNGQINPRAGWAFVYRPSAYSETGELTHGGTIPSRLENEGPTGKQYTQTSNRAELRAVTAALQFRDWSTDCNGAWRSVVIATDSEYVAVGATKWVEHWENSGWKLTDQVTDAKNQDLWKLLLSETRKLRQRGVNVSFWRIARELNERADKYAKLAAQNEEIQGFRKFIPSGPTKIKVEPY
ncbi:hypothetical protein EG329_006727 [Mollisiaceae sp. DMI_Dod_QoI]|nr:hypothetical protein EG329_006727 [Helotiales sp. DMI_Dod_QoI]